MTVKNLNDITDVLVAQIETRESRVHAGIQLNPNAPCVMVIPKAPWDIAATFDGGLDIDFSLVCVASANIMEGSQQTLRDWLSRDTDSSLIDLFLGTELSTPAGVITATARTVDSYGLDSEPSNAMFVMAEITVNVLG